MSIVDMGAPPFLGALMIAQQREKGKRRRECLRRLRQKNYSLIGYTVTPFTTIFPEWFSDESLTVTLSPTDHSFKVSV